MGWLKSLFGGSSSSTGKTQVELAIEECIKAGKIPSHSKSGVSIESVSVSSLPSEYDNLPYSTINPNGSGSMWHGTVGEWKVEMDKYSNNLATN